MAEELQITYDKIYRYTFYRIRNAAAAQDITQEAFLRYFSRNATLSRGEDMAYLYTIAKNLCADYFRKKPPDEIPEDYPAEESSDKLETRIAVRAAMEKLDENQRELVSLRYLGGLSVSETAQTLGISRFAVYRLERSALGEMKKYLKGAL